MSRFRHDPTVWSAFSELAAVALVCERDDRMAITVEPTVSRYLGSAHSRRWVTRQSAGSAISGSTTRALIVAEAVHDGARTDLTELLGLLGDLSRGWGTPRIACELTAHRPDMPIPEIGRSATTPR